MTQIVPKDLRESVEHELDKAPSPAAMQRAKGLAQFLALFGMLPGVHKRWYPQPSRPKHRGPDRPHQGAKECARRRRQKMATNSGTKGV